MGTETISRYGDGARWRLLAESAARMDAFDALVGRDDCRQGSPVFVACCALVTVVRYDAEWSRDSGLLLHFGVVR